DHHIGALRTHDAPDAQHALRPRAVDVAAHAHAGAACRAEPRRVGPAEEDGRVAARRESRRRIDHPALHAAVDGALVRVDEEDAHLAGVSMRAEGSQGSMAPLRPDSRTLWLLAGAI